MAPKPHWGLTAADLVLLLQLQAVLAPGELEQVRVLILYPGVLSRRCRILSPCVPPAGMHRWLSGTGFPWMSCGAGRRGLSPRALLDSETRDSWCGGLSTDPEGAHHGIQALTLLSPQRSRAQKRRQCCTARIPIAPERKRRPRWVLRVGAAAAWGLGGEKGRRTTPPNLPLPEGPLPCSAALVLPCRMCIPCWCQGPACHLTAQRRVTRFPKLP